MLMSMSLDYPVTFVDHINSTYETNFSESNTTQEQNFIKSHEWNSVNPYYNDKDISQICMSERSYNDQETPSYVYDGKEIPSVLPLHQYTFNPGIYQTSSLSIPRKFIQTFSEDKQRSLNNNMPHWTYYNPTPTHQEQFISKHFPERLPLYHHYKHTEEKNNLFIYLWIYVNGGLYISSDYEILKPIDDILDTASTADLYFMFDHERYISPKLFASQPFCGFWMEVVNLMEKRKNHHYIYLQDQINKNTGRELLTDVANETQYKYEILPRSSLDPYTPCDTIYNKDSYLRPLSNSANFLTYMKCQTGSTDELLYIAGVIIFVIVIMVIIAIITQ